LYDLSFHVLVGTFFARFVFTWLYNRSYGDLLPAILFHTAANTASQFMPVTNASLWIEAAFALVVVLGTRMWQRLPAGSPAAQGGNALPA
jgi:hypothetical protein